MLTGERAFFGALTPLRSAAMGQGAGIRPHDSLIAETTSEGILLQTAVTLPVEIYFTERMSEFDAAESELAELLGQAKRPRK
jgi:hypothetical protein